MEHPLSLDRLLIEFVGVSLDKAGKFTHWDNRPLSAMQMRYAADDVRYLSAAREAIGKRLAELGRGDWARQECASALEDISLYKPAPEALYLRVRQRDRLRRRHLAVLRELAIWRDQAARAENLPTRTLLKDGILVAMARRPAGSLADLGAYRGLPRPVESKYGRQIVEATARGLAVPEDQLPPPEPEEPWALRARADKVWASVSEFCLGRLIAPSLVASRKEVGRACRALSTGQAAGQHRLLRGWRKELLADLLDSHSSAFGLRRGLARRRHVVRRRRACPPFRRTRQRRCRRLRPPMPGMGTGTESAEGVPIRSQSPLQTFPRFSRQSFMSIRITREASKVTLLLALLPAA